MVRLLIVAGRDRRPRGIGTRRGRRTRLRDRIEPRLRLPALAAATGEEARRARARRPRLRERPPTHRLLAPGRPARPRPLPGEHRRPRRRRRPARPLVRRAHLRRAYRRGRRDPQLPRATARRARVRRARRTRQPGAGRCEGHELRHPDAAVGQPRADRLRPRPDGDLRPPAPRLSPREGRRLGRRRAADRSHRLERQQLVAPPPLHADRRRPADRSVVGSPATRPATGARSRRSARTPTHAISRSASRRSAAMPICRGTKPAARARSRSAPAISGSGRCS